MSKRMAVVSLALAAAVSAIVVADALAQSRPQHGARCPANTQARFENGVLTCTRNHVDRADVACPPQNALLNVELVVTPGRDKCKVPGTPVNNSLPNAGCFTLPTDQGWALEVDAGGTIRDRCVRRRTDFVRPDVF
jgi:hypothetical protein